MSLVTNVFRRGGSYYFRTRVPARFRALLERKELWRSLRTADAREARRRASLAALLTERLWRDLERGMSSVNLLTDSQLETLIHEWLKAELGQDAVLRRRSEQDREAPWHAAAIMERAPEGEPDRLIEWLDEAQLDALQKARKSTVDAKIGPGRYLLTTVNEAHLERGLRHRIFEDSLARHEAGDTTIAAHHIDDLFKQHGLSVDANSDDYDDAVRMMTRAHRDLLEAVQSRDLAMWRPKLDRDPAEGLLASLRSSPRIEPAKDEAPVPPISRRAGLSFSEAAAEALIGINRVENFKPKRRDDYQNAVETFLDWLGRDPLLGEITPEIAGDFQVALGEYPSNVTKKVIYRDLESFKERRLRAAQLGETALLNPVTINGKYLTPLRKIFDWQKSAGSGVGNPFEGIAAKKPRKSDPKKARRIFSQSETDRFFSLPAFTGVKALNGSGSAKPGPLRIRDYRFWVPLICFFHGMRLNEACGLAIADIKSQEGVVYFHVRDEIDKQSVKNPTSRRKVPVHEKLIEMGLLDQVAIWRAEGRERLFQELRANSTNYYSHGPSRLFNGWVRKIVDADPDDVGKLVFHSTRHTVVTRLRAAQVREDVSKAIVGHEKGDVHASYGDIDLPTMKAAIDKIAYPGLDLTRIWFTS